MPAIDIPTLGNLLLAGVLISASYTFAVSIAAARGRPHLTAAARGGIYATIALVASSVFLLAYAFQAHDFRIRYVARYSDRSMTAGYLWTALWGGQDGSLLWWCFLLSLYTLAFTLWIRKKHHELQPVAFATLASIFVFFGVLMQFAANPFATGGAMASPADGEGLNPLLQNYWMAIHPPALYMGLTGWAVPFAIVVAALFTGRLGDEWMLAARRWVILAWGFLALGNMLGMFWSYEELGWGGYWAWDPVENAAFMPWLLGTAYVHSTMIQERRGMLRVWNVALLSATFFFTIFGTFLTRSGLIASVHSFARSDIGIYFVWYMGALALFIITLIAYRLPELRGRLIGLADEGTGTLIVFAVLAPIAAYAKLVEIVRVRLARGKLVVRARPAGEIDSLLSREFMYLLNNWILTGMFLSVLVATTFPLISEAVRGETVTVGPTVYNHWMVPLALCLLFLMGVGPLIAWRKASGKNLRDAFTAPTIAGVVVGLAHAAIGSRIGFPAVVESSDIYGTWTGTVLAAVSGIEPLVCTTLAAFVVAAIIQEFWRGTAARMRTTKEGALTALTGVVSRARRRYGGYVVHLGIVFMYLGFLGAAYDLEREDTLTPGETMEVGDVSLRFERAHTEVDVSADMLFADLTVMHGDTSIATVTPAKFVYRSHPDMPTTEVSIRSTPLSDLYVILSTVDPDTGRATFRVINRPLVWWIWFGGLIVLLGAALAAFPSVREILGEETDRARAPARPGLAAAVMLLALAGAAGIAFAASTASAQADGTSSLHAGTVEIHDPVERQLFERLLCECGDCQRLPLSTCGCSWAENMRAELRGDLASGMSVVQIQADYRERFGAQAISVPSDSGLDRALWLAPLVAIGGAFVGLWLVARRWRDRGQLALARDDAQPAAKERSALDDRLDDELKKLD
jgi:cytochrome c-type biogenesis protein CcmF